MQHSKDDESFADEEIGNDGNAQGQAQYPGAPLQKPQAKPIFLPQELCPRVAQGEGESDEEEKERGGEAGHCQPEAGRDIDIVDGEIVQIEDQMVEDHEEDGPASQEIHLPETDRRALDHFTIIFHSLVHSFLKAALSFLTSTFRFLYIPLYFDGSQSAFPSQTCCTSISSSTVVDF